MTTNPFARAQGLITQALTLLEASDPPPAPLVDAVDSLLSLRLLFDAYGKRPDCALSKIEYGILADDFAALDDLLSSPRHTPIRALISQAQRVIAAAAAQPAGVDVVREAEVQCAA